MIYDSALDIIGKTPIIRATRLKEKYGLKGELLLKLEKQNPAGSSKDRVALFMVEKAEREGQLKKGGCVIEPTSGNTGIGLALVCAVKGYRLILTMPSSMSEERKVLLRSMGAEIVLTDPEAGMAGAVNRAEELEKEIAGSVILGQFENPENPASHRETTAQEILLDCGESLDCFIAGVGTGGTITGVGEVLKSKNRGVRIVAVEPYDSPLLSQGKAGAHKIQGIGANFIPNTLNREIIDEIVPVKTDDAFECARALALAEGITCGISGGAVLHAGIKYLSENQGKTVLVLLPDGGDRYLSTELFK